MLDREQEHKLHGTHTQQSMADPRQHIRQAQDGRKCQRLSRSLPQLNGLILRPRCCYQEQEMHIYGVWAVCI